MENTPEFYRKFFDLCPGLLCVAGTEGRFKAVNAAWEKLLQLDADYLTSRPYFDLLHPDDQQRTITETKKIAKGQSCANFENRYLTRDKHIKWLSWNATRTVEDDLIIASAADITFRKTFEQCLSDNITRLQEIMDHLNVSIWVTDAHGKRAAFSRNWYEISQRLPLASEEMLHQIHPEDKERYTRAFTNGFNEQRPIIQQYRLKAGGEEQLMIDKGIPWYDSEGKFSGYIGVCLEINSPKIAGEEVIDRLLEELRTFPMQHYA
ncbi:MAG: PAS domain-containing protein [Alphaproteobacteria bacterium]|nr:PAS domain-containing protein [Alphaproteobacteria bacterium]